MNVKIEENINKFKKPLIEHMSEPSKNTPTKTIIATICESLVTLFQIIFIPIL